MTILLAIALFPVGYLVIAMASAVFILKQNDKKLAMKSKINNEMQQLVRDVSRGWADETEKKRRQDEIMSQWPGELDDPFIVFNKSKDLLKTLVGKRRFL